MDTTTYTFTRPLTEPELYAPLQAYISPTAFRVAIMFWAGRGLLRISQSHCQQDQAAAAPGPEEASAGPCRLGPAPGSFSARDPGHC